MQIRNFDSISLKEKKENLITYTLMLILKFVSRPLPPSPPSKKNEKKKTIDNKPVRK